MPRQTDQPGELRYKARYDERWRGVWQDPSEVLLGLQRLSPVWVEKGVFMYELGYFCALLAAGDQDVIRMLTAPEAVAEICPVISLLRTGFAAAERPDAAWIEDLLLRARHGEFG